MEIDSLICEQPMIVPSYHIMQSTLNSCRYEYVFKASFCGILLLLLVIGCQSVEVMFPHPHLLYWVTETDEIILSFYEEI